MKLFKQKLPKIRLYKTWIIDHWEYYYLLVGANGEPMNTSEMYTTKSSAKRAAKAMRRAAALATFEDYT
jgi:uncharacterized protein YegP (UPF0339 family)